MKCTQAKSIYPLTWRVCGRCRARAFRLKFIPSVCFVRQLLHFWGLVEKMFNFKRLNGLIVILYSFEHPVILDHKVFFFTFLSSDVYVYYTSNTSSLQYC